mmetsp:Transcript_46484/g.95064  ORF Transcript_46484/g.95064 Transcript_46484/m.95064 type:complete len:236 (+) Transcript_46484:1127-1834(+)
MYDVHALSSGSHWIQRSKIWRAPGTFPIISSMYAYLYQNWSTRGRMATARSQMLRARLMLRWRISISAYLSHSVTLRWSTSSARSHTLRARSNSNCVSSHMAYFTHSGIACRLRRIPSSNSFLFLCRYSASSSGSVIFCFAGFGSSSCRSFASRRICSAVICTGAGCLFLTRAMALKPRMPAPPLSWLLPLLLPSPLVMSRSTAFFWSSIVLDLLEKAGKFDLPGWCLAELSAFR